MFKNLKKNYFSLVSIFLILYFFFNLMSGDRGLISYFDKKQILINLQFKESKLLENIEKLEFNNSDIASSEITENKVLYFKKIVKPTSDEIKIHNDYLKKELKKNFFN